jgi:PAS domain S-box-containing protein
MTTVRLGLAHDFSKLRKKAEKKLKHKTVAESEHELDVHKEELLMQAHELLSTQEKLVSSLEEYAQLFNLAPLGYFVLDKNGNVLDLNATAKKLFERTRDEMIKHPFSIFLNGKRFQDDYYRHRHYVLETGQHQQLESEIIRKDGTIVSVLIESTVVKNKKNNFKHFLSSVINISDRKEQELNLKQALSKERELNSMKSRFVSMASHEFRTPLAAIQTSADIIAMHIKSNNTANSTKHIQRISASINHLTDILNDFLLLDKLEQGEMKIKSVKTNVKKLITETISKVELVIKPNQTIEYVFEGETEFKIDGKILCTIIHNLLSNASKYSAEGKKIEFKVNVTNNKISIEVKDQGIGIPMDEQSKIFTRLFRAKNAEMIEGTGLGLNILKKNIELLNGKINFISKENIGSTFMVEIPN